MTTPSAPHAASTTASALPRERPCNADAVTLLDTPLRRAIERVTEHGWVPTDAWPEPGDLAASIAYCLRLRGISRWVTLGLVESLIADADYQWSSDYDAARKRLAEAVWGGRHRAESHAAQSMKVEVTHAAIQRATRAGASWTGRLFMRPATPPAASPTETSYACELLDEDAQPTAELRALVDAFGGVELLDLVTSPPEHPLLLRDRLPGRLARAITRDDQRHTTHLLRLGGY